MEEEKYATWAEKFRIGYIYFAKKLKSSLNAKKILDVGCGSGILGNELSKIFQDAEIVGIDKNVEMCKMSRAIVADANLLPFKDGSFDLVIFSFSLHDTGLRAIYEAKRVLKNDGAIAIRDINSEMPLNIKKFVLDALRKNISESYAERVSKAIWRFPSPRFVANFMSKEFEEVHLSKSLFDFEVIAKIKK